MNTAILVILCAAVSYLIGSVSASILISQFILHHDVRQEGSGNAGAANAARVFGPWVGLATFGGDFLKGVIAMALGSLLLGQLGVTVCGICCLLGHCFPVFFGFKGGKAVSTGAAVALMLDWRIFLIGIAVFLIVAVISKTASISSMSAAISIVVSAFIFCRSAEPLILAVFTGALVVFMHRSNISRIFKGTEPKFRFGHQT